MIRFENVPPVMQGECRVVAEIGNPPTVNAAMDLVEAAAQAGAWGVKAQLLSADTITTRHAATYSHGLTEPSTQHEAFRHALPYSAWEPVKELCDELGVLWFASCWDFAAVDACEEMGVELYKVGSGDITHRPLLEYIGATGKPIVLSTGGATEREIDRACEWIGHGHNVVWHGGATGDDGPEWQGTNPSIAVLACSLSYPCAEEDANVARVRTLAELGYPLVGYSDHTRSNLAATWAAQNGAVMVEKHFTVTPGAGGDHDFAARSELFPDLFHAPATPSQIMRPIIGDGRLGPMQSEQQAVVGARRSIVATRNLNPGDPLEGNVTWLRPGTGLPPWFDITGITAAQPITAGSVIHADDIT